MATPATRTPIKLARGSYSNLYASIDDIQEGEIVYAEDQNQLYVKEGSQLIDVTGDGGSGGSTTNLGYSTSGAGLSITSSTGSNIDLPAATTSAWGLMTDEDKTALDGFTEGTTDLSNTANGTSLTVESSSGNNTALPAATTSAWGVMTDEDKTNLDANTAKVTNATHTGEVTGSGALTIADNAVVTDRIADDAVTADKLANSINTEIAANTAKTTNATHTGDVTGSGALTIADDAVTYAKMQNVSATDRVLGRDSSGAGVVEEITPANLRTMINVEDGATADQSNAEIRAAVEAASDSNVFTDDDHSKLNGIAASANNYAISSDLVDEDNMSSNSATKVPSQQSVKAYVDTEVAGVVDSAPGALDTLNELAAALGDDANFSTTVTNSIAAKLPLGGGTMTGNIVMSGSETVDGRDLSADGSKLDGIESNATADQTNTEIRTAVEAATDSNVFTDDDHSKLNGIAASANNYTHPSVNHIPAGGSSGQVLKYSSSGTAAWGTDNDTTYSTVSTSASGLAPTLPGSHGGKFLKADGTWEVPPDTNTQVSIDDTPVNGVTNEAISSNWAYDHNAATGNSAHVPAAGSSGQFLKHDGTWGTPPDTNTQVSIDDTPVDGVTNEAISSNWAYDHNAGTGNSKHVPAAGSSGQFLKHDGTWGTPPDTNTQRGIDDTPVDGQTAESISSNWAYDHNAATGNSAHVPAAGSSGQFLKHDGTWGTPTDTNTQLSNAEVRTAVEAATDSNVFTDDDHSKLNAIEATADVTDSTNVNSAGAVMNSDLDGKGELLVGDGSGDPSALAVGTNNYVLTADSGEATGVKWAATATGTPEGTAILSTGESGGSKFLREDGDGTCSWQTVSSGGGGDVTAVTAGTGLTGGGSSGDLTVNADVGIADDKLLQVDDADAADNDYAKFTANGIEGRSYAEVKTDLSLNNVENTAVSTWAGTSNITTLGTIGTGTWQGTAIGDTYISSASTWNAKQAALTFGIANTNAVKIDHASVADDDYAKFTSSGVEGRSAAEVKTDLSLNNVENTAVSTWAGSANITTLGTVNTVTSTAHGTAGVRKIYTSTSAPTGGANGDVWIKYTA